MKHSERIATGVAGLLIAAGLQAAGPREIEAGSESGLVAAERQSRREPDGYRIVPAGHRTQPLRVRVWCDRGEDAVYYPGERVEIRFSPSDAAYVCVYDIDTEGRVQLLFPGPGDDGFVHADEVVTIPGPHAGFDYVVTGPPGIETIEVVASRARLVRFQDAWDRRQRGDDEDEGIMWEEDEEEYDRYDGDDVEDDVEYELDDDRGFVGGGAPGHNLRPAARPYATGLRVSGDPFVAIRRVNRRLLPSGCTDRDYDTAYLNFHVGRRVRYPRYACNDCHGPYHAYDPYHDRCSVFSVRVNLGWTYPAHHVHVRHRNVIHPRYVYVRHERVPPRYRHLKWKWPSHDRYRLHKEFAPTPAWKSRSKIGPPPSGKGGAESGRRFKRGAPERRESDARVPHSKSWRREPGAQGERDGKPAPAAKRGREATVDEPRKKVHRDSSGKPAATESQKRRGEGATSPPAKGKARETGRGNRRPT